MSFFIILHLTLRETDLHQKSVFYRTELGGGGWKAVRDSQLFVSNAIPGISKECGFN